MTTILPCALIGFRQKDTTGGRKQIIFRTLQQYLTAQLAGPIPCSCRTQHSARDDARTVSAENREPGVHCQRGGVCIEIDAVLLLPERKLVAERLVLQVGALVVSELCTGLVHPLPPCNIEMKKFNICSKEKKQGVKTSLNEMPEFGTEKTKDRDFYFPDFRYAGRY